MHKHIKAMNQTLNRAHPTEMSSHYLCSSLLHRFGVTVKTLCVILMMGQGKGGDRFLFKLVYEREWGDWNSHDWHPSVPTLFFNTYAHVCEVLTVHNVSLKPNKRVPKLEASSKTSWLLVCLCACTASVWLSSKVRWPREKMGQKIWGWFSYALSKAICLGKYW